MMFCSLFIKLHHRFLFEIKKLHGRSVYDLVLAGVSVVEVAAGATVTDTPAGGG